MQTTATALQRPLNLARLGLVIVAAVLVNVVVYAVGSAAGATWIANDQTVNAVLVVLATIIAMVIGGVITWLLARRWAKAPSAMAWVGLVFAVISAPAPLVASSDAATSAALAAMHVVTGIAWFFAVHPSRSSRVS